MNLRIRKESPAKPPAMGIVSTQAQTILRATPHFTADSLRVAPTPIMAPVIVWVVETGMPASVAPKRVIAPAVSAQKPPTGFSFVIFEPIVCTIRQPPESVPNAIAPCAESTTHKGISGDEPPGPAASNPPDTSTAVIIPIVF